MGFIKEFREFAIKGNVVDLAVGVIIGGAFGKIISSLLSDIIMPLINPLIPGGNWRNIEVGNGIKLGNFLGSVLDFMTVALVIFILIRVLNRLNKKQEAAPAPSKEELLL